MLVELASLNAISGCELRIRLGVKFNSRRANSFAREPATEIFLNSILRTRRAKRAASKLIATESEDTPLESTSIDWPFCSNLDVSTLSVTEFEHTPFEYTSMDWAFCSNFGASGTDFGLILGCPEPILEPFLGRFGADVGGFCGDF